MDAEKINKKIEITWAAVDIYQEKKKVSIPDLVNKTNISATEIYQLFPNKQAILAYYYPALVLQYWAMIEEIEDFESYAICEKFSNFIYTIFDMMSEKEAFVIDTFNKYVFKKGSKSKFHEETTTLFKEFLTTDSNIAVSAGFFMGDIFYKTLSSQFLFLIQYWLKDSSKENVLCIFHIQFIHFALKYTQYTHRNNETKVVKGGRKSHLRANVTIRRQGDISLS